MRYYFDACSIINISTDVTMADIVRNLFAPEETGRTKHMAVTAEVVEELRGLAKAGRPHCGEANRWLGSLGLKPVTIDDLAQIAEIDAHRYKIQGGVPTNRYIHIGEASEIVAIEEDIACRRESHQTAPLISDDHGARTYARTVHAKGSDGESLPLQAFSSVSLAWNLRKTTGGTSEAGIDAYLDTLRSKGRITTDLTTSDIEDGDWKGWL